MAATDEKAMLDAFLELGTIHSMLMELCTSFMSLVDLDDVHAMEYKEIRKAIWRGKLLEAPLERARIKKELVFWEVGPRDQELQRTLGKLAYPHLLNGEIAENIINIYGILPMMMDEIVRNVEKLLKHEHIQERHHIRHGVFMTLCWMRKNPTFVDLGQMYGMNRGQAYKTVRRFLDYLQVATNAIPESHAWRSTALKYYKNRYGATVATIGSVDCTGCPRNNRHPNSYLLIRGDREGASLTTQILVDFEDQILEVIVAYGHNGDEPIFVYGGTRDRLIEQNLAILTDLGYEADHLIITPESGTGKSRTESDFNTAQASKRSGVEQVNGLIKGKWKVVAGRCRASPRMQAQAIVIACSLVNRWREALPRELTVHNTGRDDHTMEVDGPECIRGQSRERAIQTDNRKNAALEQLERTRRLMEEKEP